jgi:hypothetical protein
VPLTSVRLEKAQFYFCFCWVLALLQGAECFPVFMKSGLDKALLKRMWDLVAGNAGSLNAEQFFKCMYLMDGCRRGAALPAVLPPGPWPQVNDG